MITTADELAPLQRDLIRGLVRGASAQDVAWAVARPPEEVLKSARAGLAGLNPELATQLDTDDLRRLLDYLLRRQSPGQAAGTWELLERTAVARRFALFVREALADDYGAAPPAIPGLDEFDPAGRGAVVRAQASTARDRARGRREARRRARERRKALIAAAHEQSPYRVRAMEHFAKGQEAISLPRFAPPLLVAAMWSLLALVAIAFVLAVSITVPTYSQAAALLVERGQEGWPTVVALFPPSETGRVRRGQEVRLTLPGSERKVTLRIGQVEGVLSAEEIRRRFELSPAAAAAVSGPAAVALMPLRLPPGAGRPADFVDTVAVADGHLGDRRIVSLLPVIGD